MLHVSHENCGRQCAAGSCVGRPWRGIRGPERFNRKNNKCAVARALLKESPNRPSGKDGQHNGATGQECKQQSTSAHAAGRFPALPSMDPWGLLNSTQNFANQLITHFSGALTQQSAEQVRTWFASKKKVLQRVVHG